MEKITEPGERLPAGWPVAGTTGYDALTEVNALLYDPADEAAATEAYQRLTGDQRDWATHLEQGKRLIATTILQAELRRIARGIRAAEPELPIDDATVVDALTELAVAFGVYRSYQPEGDDRLVEAIEVAGRRRPELAEAIEQIRPLLANGDREVTVRFEQATGAIMAKGCEDTAYYRYNRAIGLNEVGGDPAGYGSTIEQFHQAQAQRQQLLPESMTTLSTHDTKRSEDVRARLAVLSELGERWYDTAATLLERAPVGNQAFGYLLWQTFAGAGWIERERMHAYAEKAMREAAEGTSWRDQDEAFEQRVHEVVDLAYDDERLHAELDRLIRLIDPYGWSNSLSGKLIQLTMPGVPDVYQGTELFDYSLVDPDNRRDVDFEQRRRLLARVRPAGAARTAAGRHRRGQVVAGPAGVAGAPRTSRAADRLPAAAGHRPGGAARGGLRPRRPGHGGHPVAVHAAPHGRLARYRTRPAGRRAAGSADRRGAPGPGAGGRTARSLPGSVVEVGLSNEVYQVLAYPGH